MYHGVRRVPLAKEPGARKAKPRQGRLSRLHDNLVAELDGGNVQRASAVHEVPLPTLETQRAP